MKTYLLPDKGNFYKANLHAHSTLSDGHFCPEEIKATYKLHGYSVFAYTEHGQYYDMRYLDDADFITLPAYEFDFRNYMEPAFRLYEGAPMQKDHMECVHMNLFAVDPEHVGPIVKNYEILGCTPEERLQQSFTVDHVNEAIRRAHEAGFIVSFNHPHWSLNAAELYNKLEGLDAIELINGACNRSSNMDFVPHVYREMAWNGKRAVCFAGDDNHRAKHFFQAWTMVKAPKLDHKSIMTALTAGNCYVSSGPEIKELYVEDGVLHIKTSEAQGIHLATAGRRKAAAVQENETDPPVTEAAFPILPEDVFFHVIVRDLRGRPAATRIYYLDELKGV